MAAAHEVTLVTKSIGAITKVEVNPNIAHPLPISPVIQEMDAWYEAGNPLDLLHYLKKLDAYTLRFNQRTQDLVSNIEHLSAFVCNECFGPHNTKECNKHKNKCESQDINDQESENDDDESESEDSQESENDDEESDKQHSEYEDEMATSTCATTPVNACRLFAKKCIWTRVCAPIQLCSSFFATEAIANLS